MRRFSLISVVAVLAMAGTTVACSSDGGSDGGSEEEREATDVTTRPEGPAAELAGPLEGGKGINLFTAGTGPDLDSAGYTEAEYTATGTATSYTPGGSLPADGTYELQPGEEGDYTTRIVVRRPEDPDAFNGTVVVEWLNVSGGGDAAPDYTYLAEELLRGGYAWVGVSAQRIGIEGGQVAVQAPGAEGAGAGAGLKGIDPDRYGDLEHPGDAFSYDMYTQVARSLRTPGDVDPLEGLDMEQMLAIGESQSAFALTTYVNGVQPLTVAFDGFLIHSRGGSAAPLGEPGGGIDIAGAISGEPTTIRDDIDVPVMTVETEGDLLGVLSYLPARQPDSDNFRLWEVAGAAHADVFQVGSDMEGMLGCPDPINRGQQVFVLRAALRHLDTWARGGDAPPEAPRLEVDESGESPTFVVDDAGNTRGGVRTPVVEAPVDLLSGQAAEDASIICLLMGRTEPLSEEQLGKMYDSKDDYLEQYEQATDELIEAGYLLADDRDEILDGADPSRLPD